MTARRRVIEWLLGAEEPWVRWGAMVHLEGRPPDDPDVREAHRQTLRHPGVKGLMAECRAWPGAPIKRHDDAKHPVHGIGVLAGMGLRADDRGMKGIVRRLAAHRSAEGAFQSKVLFPEAFGGSGRPEWGWFLCDAPLVLDALLAFGVRDGNTDAASDHLASLAGDDGWPCRCHLPGVRGPGRKADPCPYATLICLRALSNAGGYEEACRAGTDSLLRFWSERADRKIRMFGIGTDFAKAKYPMVWFDVLHVVDVLSRFEWVRGDRRFREMRDLLLGKADGEGRVRPESVWMAYRGFDFGQKRGPSPTLTLAVMRVRARA